jgi:hypothetical protein
MVRRGQAGSLHSYMDHEQITAIGKPATPPDWVRQAVEETLRQLEPNQPQAEVSPIIGFGKLLQRLGDAYGERGLRDLSSCPASFRASGQRAFASWHSTVSV